MTRFLVTLVDAGLDLKASSVHVPNPFASIPTWLLGLLTAVLAAALNGTFSIFSKDEIRGLDVDIFVFHFWACLGVAGTGLLVLLGSPVVWTPWGAISGLLLVLASGCAFFAASLIGVSVGPGIWCGSTALVSFFFGLLMDPNGRGLSSLPLALAGLALLTGAIAGIAYAGDVSMNGGEENENLLEGGKAGRVSRMLSGCSGRGLTLAVIAGALGGLILMPMEYAPAEARGIQFLPSMAVGVLLAAPFVTLLALFVRGKKIELNAIKAAAPGLAAGVCWNGVNAASILSIGYLGYMLTYPIVQSGLFVSGLWGIFVFNEMKDARARKIYWLSGPFLLLGASLLACAR